MFADDLTGACDTGVVFSSKGLATRVLLPSSSPSHADGARVRAHTLESRNLSAEKAAAVQVACTDALNK